jgi:Carboxypeptidase regulatory-like domain/TonB-dependent Receptor Plug Domain
MPHRLDLDPSAARRRVSAPAWRAALIALALATPLAAQGPSRLATIRGTVIDSIHGGGLIGASVSVDGTAASAVTDSLGAYQIAGVPGGTYRIAVYHPFLDSLNIALYTAPTPISPPGETVIPLALPSLVTLLRRYCGADSSARVLVAGRLLDVDSDTPIENGTAVGSVETMSIATGQGGAKGVLRRSAVTRTAKTSMDGRFQLCLPAGAHYSIIANLGNSLTGEIPFDAATGIVMPALRVSRADSAILSSRATLAGRVLTAGGKPIDGATVTVEGTVVTVRTGHDGTFRLAASPAGTQIISVRHVGFAAMSTLADLSSATTHTITVTLRRDVPTLPTVDVKGEALLVAAAYDRLGFNVRKHAGVGQFVTADQIARHNSSNATTLLEGVPGVLAQYTSRGGVRLVTSHGVGGRSCTGYLVDGQNVQRGPNSDNDFLPPARDIIGIEVYQPGEPIGGRAPSNCLVIVIWTKAELDGG